MKQPVRRENIDFHLARIYVDDKLQVPVRYEAYDWPETEGGSPLLMEEYTFLDLKLNVGLSQADFRRANLGR